MPVEANLKFGAGRWRSDGCSAVAVPVPVIVVAAMLAAALAGCTTIKPISSGPAAAEQAAPRYAALDIGRGKLFYDAQCVTCHTAEVHWRDKSIVSSWVDIVVQVDRWQQNTGQQWGSSEVGDVAAYLNSVYYKQPCSIPGCLGQSSVKLQGGVLLANGD